MAEPIQKRQKVTPRNSEIPLTDENETPYNTLHTLSKLARPPTTPAISSTTPHALSARRTPGTGRTPRHPLENVFSGRRTAPTTPHAIRAQQERARNAIPLSARKRLTVKRETPRGLMRELSRVLAKTSNPVEPSPAEPVQTRRKIRGLDDDSDDEIPRDVPRLSIPFNEDDDSFHEAPRFSMNMSMDDDDEPTMRSVEAGRERLSRSSYGRVSEINDITGLGLDISNMDEETVALGADGDLTFRAPFEEVEALNVEESDAAARSQRPRRGTTGSPETDDEPTFRFRIPDRAKEPTLMDEEAAEMDIDDEAVDPTELADVTFASAVPMIEDDAGYQSDSGQAQVLEDDEEEGDDTILARLRQDSVEAQALPITNANETGAAHSTRERAARELKISKHGIAYPSLAPATIKRLASGFLRQRGTNGKINKETLQAISSATDWFFEQASQDLGAYAKHAGRKRIEEADVIALMKRQRAIGEKDTVFSLAQRLLPRELLQEVRMPPPIVKGRLGKRKRLETIAEEEDE